MHDIKWIREHPESFDTAMKLRGLPPQAENLIALDREKRELQTTLQNLQSQRNGASKEIGAAMKSGDSAAAERLKAEVQVINGEMKRLEETLAPDEDVLAQELMRLPNRMHPDVPEGDDEADNKELRRVGEIPKFDFTPKDHVDLGEALGGLDFAAAAAISGARFVVSKGAIARLERALSQFMLNMHITDHGYTEVNPPLLVRDDAMLGTGQLPKFAEDAFKTTNDYWLISTSEISLTNLVRESIISEQDLPLRFTAHTPCFRSEAGSAGRDTRGLIRQHQFSKVELVSITTPEHSAAEHERMTGHAEAVLQALELPYRVMLLCSGDTGFGAQRTYDIEVWLPGQDAYREISSCSVCGDFQARRMKARFKRDGEKNTEFVHTLNGSALAVGRCLVAVLENYQQADGSIKVPEVLHPYMGGVEIIR